MKTRTFITCISNARKAKSLRSGVGVGGVAVDAGLASREGFGRCLHVADVEDTAGPVETAVRADDYRVRGVMGIRTGDALKHTNLQVGLVVTIGILEEPDFRRSCDQHAAAPKLEAGDAVEFIGENNALIGHTIAIVIGQTDNAVRAPLRRIPVRGSSCSYNGLKIFLISP